MNNFFRNTIKLICFQEIDSTNNYAKKIIAQNKAQEWTVVKTNYQTCGRGQQGNTWESEADKNLIFSIILKPFFLLPYQQFQLNKAVSLALLNFLNSININNVKIKWPNDIYVENYKIAGILIENIIAGNTLSNSIIGIGLNINQKEFSKNTNNATSLKKITNINYNIEECFSKLINCIKKQYLILQDNNSNIDIEYYNYLYQLNVFKQYIFNNEIIEAKIIGVNKYGMLILKKNDDSELVCNFKEVRFL